MYFHKTKPPKVYSLLSMQVIWFYTHMINVRALLNTLLQHGKIIPCGLQLISVDKMNCLTLTLVDLAAVLDITYAIPYSRW